MENLHLSAKPMNSFLNDVVHIFIEERSVENLHVVRQVLCVYIYIYMYMFTNNKLFTKPMFTKQTVYRCTPYFMVEYTY